MINFLANSSQSNLQRKNEKEVPFGWRKLQLGNKDCSFLINQGPNPNYKLGNPNKNYRALKTKDLYDNQIFYDNADSISEENYNYFKNFELKDNDILIAIVGRGSIGKNNIFRTQKNRKYIYTRALGLIRLNHEQILSEYLNHFFHSNIGKKIINSGISGSTGQEVIQTSYIKNIVIIIPPIIEQNKIASILSTVDDLIENIDRLINSYTLLKKGLMQTLLTKGIEHTKFKKTSLGEIPEEWKIKKIGEICKSGRGRVISLKEIENKPGEYPVFSSQSKEDGCIGYLNTYDFDGEYVTWTTDGVYAGTTFYRSGRFNCTNVCGTLKSNFKDIDMKYLSLALSRCTDKYVVKLGNSKLMNNIMEIIPVPIPNDIEEQKKIGRIIQVIEDIIDINISKKKSIEVLKKGLMQQLLTGKIRVKV